MNYLIGAGVAIALMVGAYFYGVSVGKDNEKLAVQRAIQKYQTEERDLIAKVEVLENELKSKTGQKVRIIREKVDDCGRARMPQSSIDFLRD